MTKTILLVEDDVLSSEFMRLYLEGEGYNIISSTTMSEACHLITQEKPHAVITDIELADGSGFEVASHAKKHATFLKVAVSGHDKYQLSQLKEGEEKVFDHVLTKPLDLEKLGELLHSSFQ